MDNNIKESQKELENSYSRTEKFINGIYRASEKADSKNSSALFGVAGGIVGAILGIVSASYIGLSVMVLSTPLTALGIVSGILTYRGKDGIAFEKMISKNSVACDEVLKRINSLPEGTPQYIIDDLWENYRLLNGAYRNQSTIALSPSKKEEEGLLLPHEKKTK